MTSVTIQEAQAQLPDLIHNLALGGAIVITENNLPIAKLVAEPPKSPSLRRLPPGLGKDCIAIITDDSEHLQDFAEYMP